MRLLTAMVVCIFGYVRWRRCGRQPLALCVACNLLHILGFIGSAHNTQIAWPSSLTKIPKQHPKIGTQKLGQPCKLYACAKRRCSLCAGLLRLDDYGPFGTAGNFVGGRIHTSLEQASYLSRTQPSWVDASGTEVSEVTTFFCCATYIAQQKLYTRKQRNI